MAENAEVGRWRRKVISVGRKLRIRAREITAHQNYTREPTPLCKFEQLRWQNAIKSKVEIWKRTKNVVPLHCQKKDRFLTL